MAQFDSTVEVRLEGQSELIFSILSLDHQLREGDVFTYDGVSSPPVTYRVESARLYLVQARNPESDFETAHYANPKLLVGVSVVP